MPLHNDSIYKEAEGSPGVRLPTISTQVSSTSALPSAMRVSRQLSLQESTEEEWHETSMELPLLPQPHNFRIPPSVVTLAQVLHYGINFDYFIALFIIHIPSDSNVWIPAVGLFLLSNSVTVIENCVLW